MMGDVTKAAEFHGARKDAQQLLTAVEDARQDRVEGLRGLIISTEKRLREVTDEARRLPAIIAEHKAELGLLEAMSARDVLSAMLPEEAKKEQPAMLDLRSVPIGQECQADADIRPDGWVAVAQKGNRFVVVKKADHGKEVWIAADMDRDCDQWKVPALQPAHIVAPEQPTVAEHVQPPGMFAIWNASRGKFWRHREIEGMTTAAVDVGHYPEQQAVNIVAEYPDELTAYRLDDLHTVDGILKIKPGSKPATFPAVRS